jgi:hypothetical protein
MPTGPEGLTTRSLTGSNPHPGSAEDHATWLTTVVLGIAYAIAGFHHGFFEALQGNVPTNGWGIASIGEAQRMWEHGSDAAVTVIHNFLATGIAAMTLSVVIVLWCLFALRRRFGRVGFLLLFVALTAVGGGIGFVLFYLTAWAYATWMHRLLRNPQRDMGAPARTALAAVWPWALALSALLFLAGLEISVFGLPGLEPDTVLAICWSSLLVSLVLVHVAYIAGFARDRAAVHATDLASDTVGGRP